MQQVQMIDNSSEPQQSTEETPVDINNNLIQIKKRILYSNTNGFSDQNFQWIQYLMLEISTLVSPIEYRELEELWRNSYTSTADEKKLSSIINRMMVRR